MRKLIILKYMDKLTKDDIKKFALKEQIEINKYELDLIYAYIKKHPERILFEPLEVLAEIKDDLTIDLYNRLLELYDKYKLD